MGCASRRGGAITAGGSARRTRLSGGARSACVGYDLQKDGSRHVSYDVASSAVRAAFTAWTSAQCGDAKVAVDFRDLGAVSCAARGYDPRGPNQNVVVFHDDAWPYESKDRAEQGGAKSLTIALTTVTHDATTGEIFDADIEINGADYFVAPAESTPPGTPDAFDLQSVVLHEAGHFFGLAHSPRRSSVMYASAGEGGEGLRALGREDVAGICAIYADGRSVSTLVDPGGRVAASPCDPTPRHGYTGECAAEHGCATSPGRVDWEWIGIAIAMAVLRRAKRRWLALVVAAQCMGCGSSESSATDAGLVDGAADGASDAPTPASDAGGDAGADSAPDSAPDAAGTIADLVGIASNPKSTSLADQTDLMQRIVDLGAHRVRVDFTWQSIEPQRGQWSFGATDALVSAAAASGVEILAILDYGASWANPVCYGPNGDSNAPPDRLRDFADFAGAVALRYATSVHAYEIWNEPNNGGRFWHGATSAGTSSTVDFAPRATSTGVYGDPGLFAHLVVAASDAIRALALGAATPRVAPGGTIFLWEPPVGGVGNNSGPDFMKAAFLAEPRLASAIDAMNLHSYTAYPPDSSPESSSFEWATTNVPLGAKMTQMRAEFTAGGFAASKPAWITEVGWPNRNGVDEAKQARWLVRTLLLGALGGAERVFVYDMYDSAANSDTGAFDLVPEAYFGLVRVDGTKKASYDAIKNLTTLLGSYRVADRVSVNDPNHSVYVVRLVGPSGRQAWAAWDSNEAGSGYAWTMPPNTTCSGMLGGACAVSGGALSVTSTPAYVVER